MTATISPASSGIAGILHLDPVRHFSYIVQSGQVTFSRAQPVQRPKDGALCRISSGQGGRASIARQRRAAQGSRRTSRAIAATATDHLLKWSFTISAEQGTRGRLFFLGNQTCGAESAGKGKGCDIGYALAISSCEGASSVETR